MIRKAIIVVLTVGAVGTAAVELWSLTGPCPVRHLHPVRHPHPVRVHLGRSDRGSERFVCFASDSWSSTIGYLRLFIYASDCGPWDGEGWDEEAEAWFHAICVTPLHLHSGRIVNVVRIDDVFPSHVFQRALVVPRGLFFVLFAAYPSIAFIRGPLRRHRRRRKGWCLKCGYDLTGNVSGTCPECGTPL